MPETTLFSASQYESICNSLPDPTFILTATGRYAAILGGKDSRYYHDGSSLLGKYLSEVLSPAKTQWFLQQIHHALSSQQMLVVEYELSAWDVLGLPTEGPSEPIWFEGRLSALEQLYDGEQAVLWVASNITASKKMQLQLQQQALSDELTGLHNRRRFMQVLDEAYANFRVRQQHAYLLCFDVDHFKSINDCLGHPAGDQALRDLAQAAQALAQPGDWVCRVGGDEFVILCCSRTLESVTELAQQLLHKGREALLPYQTPGVVPTLSVGLAHFCDDDGSVEDIMRRVDQALYISKTHGGHALHVTSH